MSLYCSTDFDDYGGDWSWMWDRAETKLLATKRSRKCCSCGEKIKPGDPAAVVNRLRRPKDDIEERIYGEDGEVYMADWYFCETCNDLALSLDELGFCFELGGKQSLAEQIKEYRKEEAFWNNRRAG